jgi:hypothetical protein
MPTKPTTGGGTNLLTKPYRLYDQPLLPPWNPGTQNPEARRADINDTHVEQSRRYAAVSAEGTVIPIIYGTDNIGPIISLVHVKDGFLYLRCVWCVGEIDAVESVTIDGKAPTAAHTLTHYVGSASQGVDPTLAAVIPGYADTCVVNVDGTAVGIAYSVIKVARGSFNQEGEQEFSGTGFPRIIARIRGKKVYDPRVDAFQYSSNPACVLADLLTDRVQGLGLQVDWSSVEVNADYCDTVLGDSARYECNLTLASTQQVQSWVETVRSYARCFIVPRDNKCRFVVNTVSAVVGSITDSDMVRGTFNIEKRSLLNQPNVLKVFYTSTVSDPPTEDFVEIVKDKVLTGEEFRRQSTIQMPGFRKKAQAMRFATERMNEASLIDLSGSFDCFDKQWKYEIGDVIEITHPVGLLNKQVRVTSIDPVERGILRINFTEYDANVYSDVVVDEPPPPDSGGDSPSVPPLVTGLTLSEEFYIRGTTVGSQLAITWDAAPYAYLQYYVLEVYEDGSKLLTARIPDTFYKVRDIAPEKMYSVRIYILSVTFSAGLPSFANLQAQGYLLPPDFSSGAITVFEAGDSLYGTIFKPALDIDLWGYEWRYSEILDINHVSAGGPNWTSADWTGNTSDCTFSYRAFTLSFNSLSFGSPVTKSITKNLSLPLGKRYDVYVKVTDSSNLSSLGATGNYQSGVVLEFPSLGKTTILYQSANFSSYKKGVFVAKNVLIEHASQVLRIVGSNTTVGTTMTLTLGLEYVCFRESEEDCEADWNASKFIERSSANSVRVDSLQSSQYVMLCRALDSVRTEANPFGQYSDDIKSGYATVVNEDSKFARESFAVTFASNAGFQSIPCFTENEFQYKDHTGQWCRSVFAVPCSPAVGSPAMLREWNELFTSPLNSYSTPLYGLLRDSAFNTSDLRLFTSPTIDLKIPQSSGGSAWMECEHFDVGTSQIRYTATVDLAGIGGVPTPVSTMASLESPTAFIANRVTISAGGTTSCREIYKFNSKTLVKINRNSRVETGTVTTNAADGSGNPVPKKITLSNRYVAVIQVRGWSNTQEPVEVKVDNITFGDSETTFTVVALNLRGLPVATSITWNWRGY